MNIKVGLVGLPNVGKSSLFNALTKSSVPAENYPFCTIDPHVAITHVPDDRIEKLQKTYDSKKQIPATVSFVDIAGLVKGAAAGQGLGNQFLSNIQEVNLVLHVLRCFEDDNVIREQGAINPLEDFETIVNELMLKDLESLQKRQTKIQAQLKKHSISTQEKKDLEAEQILLGKIAQFIDNLDVANIRQAVLESSVPTIPLLSSKNFMVIANVSEEDIDNPEQNKFVQQIIEKFGKDRVIPVCVKTELELSQLDDAEKQEMMDMLGLQKPMLETVIEKSYQNLGLITFFTCGPQEIHAWPIKQGTSIKSAAGEIHSDLERGFICAEVFNYNDLQDTPFAKLKEIGKIRTEGKDYVTQDGDIVLVRFNV